MSLESVIDPLISPLLSSIDRTQALSIFEHIVQYCESYELLNTLTPIRKYKRGKLLQLVYDHAISDHGKDNILRYFLSTMTTRSEERSPSYQEFSHVLTSLSDFKDRNNLEKDKIVLRVQELADHLVDGFFIPLRASSAKTPQPTPHLTPKPREGGDILVGTTQRLSSLRGQCLVRDRHRCVISSQFDEAEAIRRFEIHGAAVIDDDGKLISDEIMTHLEVAHIIPHALTSSDDGQIILNKGRIYTLQILDMFDPGVIHLVDGANIDRSYNAITLSSGFHRRFGSLQIYFEAKPGLSHTYTIKSTILFLTYQPKVPITRSLFITPEHTIDHPMPRLLAIHRACCLILHLSGAAEYVDKVLRDREASTAMSDGSTELGIIVGLKLHKLNSTAY